MGPWQLIKGNNSATPLIAEHFAAAASFTPSEAGNEKWHLKRNSSFTFLNVYQFFYVIRRMQVNIITVAATDSYFCHQLILAFQLVH